LTPQWVLEDLAAGWGEASEWEAGMVSAMAARDSTDIRAVMSVAGAEAMGTEASMAARCLTVVVTAATEPAITQCRRLREAMRHSRGQRRLPPLRRPRAEPLRPLAKRIRRIRPESFWPVPECL